jgi:hypothetical protein
MPDTTKEDVECRERIAVSVSGVEIEKVLGIPKIENGTGKSQAENVAKLIAEWGLTENIIALSFDTTSSNIGKDFYSLFFILKVKSIHIN